MSNKWIREEGQMDRRLCGLTEDAVEDFPKIWQVLIYLQRSYIDWVNLVSYFKCWNQIGSGSNELKTTETRTKLSTFFTPSLHKNDGKDFILIHVFCEQNYKILELLKGKKKQLEKENNLLVFVNRSVLMFI